MVEGRNTKEETQMTYFEYAFEKQLQWFDKIDALNW